MITHAGPLHILCNMLAFVPLGKAMEASLGTLQVRLGSEKCTRCSSTDTSPLLQFTNLMAGLALVTALLYIMLVYVLALR